MIVAHKREDGATQSLEEHAIKTAEMAREFAAAFGCGEMGYAAGLLHDLGKQNPCFQNRILNNGPKVEHSAAGARVCFELKHKPGTLLAYCISGHHSGLPDCGTQASTMDEGTLIGKMKRQEKEPWDYTQFLKELNFTVPEKLPSFLSTGRGGFTWSFLTRMLYSCLVDADYLDTERFMKNIPGRPVKGEEITALHGKLLQHIKQFYPPAGEVNKKRCEILDTCLEKSPLPKGLYTLTVPTGGGKTIASLAFALGHAAEHKMRRVIYAIPYTSIIEQNARVFTDILGKENVLEHHSNACYDDGTEEMSPERWATENWDAPLIVTTNVQFFESLFANKSSRCRKLHNIAGSVLIFDEAQMIPIPYLIPCVYAMAELIRNYGCTVLLMSATQPGLPRYFPGGMPAREICENTSELFTFFRRVRFERAGKLTQHELAQRLAMEDQTLCIVNTRKQAQTLFEALPKEGAYHLSTLMYPAHRRAVLEEIRARLKHEPPLPCRVVSTSLVEAGVDLDFPSVYREETGLDSQIQAAGRCNREGKRSPENSAVYIFEAADVEALKRPPGLNQLIEVARIAGEMYSDTSSPEAIEAYFQNLYFFKGPEEMDKKAVIRCLEQGDRPAQPSYPFAQVARDVQFIKEDTRAILIPLCEEAKQAASELMQGRRSRELMRIAGQYEVSIYNKDFEALYSAGMLDCAKIFRDGRLVDDGEVAILTSPGQYDANTGLKAPGLGIGLFT